jgi:hypothetical protein
MTVIHFFLHAVLWIRIRIYSNWDPGPDSMASVGLDSGEPKRHNAPPPPTQKGFGALAVLSGKIEVSASLEILLI